MHKHLNTEAATFSPAPRSRRAIAWFTLLVYVGQPLAATAQVVADQAASAQKRPVIDTTANGIPLVQIATPNASGLSHNQYTQYNVDPSGIILNNSSTSVLTQQAGYVPGNQNMANGTARIILNEVTSTSPSQLNGYTEVAGSRAEIIIANPNGISCNGCGFINTSRGVLTTGTPVFGGSGSLDAFRVNGGEINIGSSGLNASNTDQLDLISRSVKVNGELWGSDINVITGTNQVNYANLGVQVISGDANKPAVGIDVALLGGMYANKIRLIGTEAGVGVNSQGNIAAQAGDITIDNQGVITLAGNTIAAGNLGISGTSLSLTGNLGAGIDTSGVASLNNTLALAATNPTGSITNSGRIAGNSITSSSDTFTNTGTVIGDNITLRANTLNNLNASAIIASTQRLDLIIQNALENRDGATLYSLGDINIGSNNLIGADGYLTGRTGSVNNQSATIEADNDLRISANQITNKRSVVGVEWAPEILGAYVSGNPRYTPSYSDQRFTAGTTPAAQILAGNNMWLSTGMITNDYSSIAAGQTLTSNATTVNNTGAAFLQRMTVTNGLQDNWVWVETEWHWGIECAGGWSPFCWPVVVPEYGLRNFPIAYAPAPTYTTLGSANVTYASNTPLASRTVDSAALKAPGSGLYTIHNQPGQPYLVVTDARFISYQNFLSSDYMMSRLALDPALIQKRLGDGAYEQKLVAEQILHATGRRNLSGYGNTQASYQALMDEALAESRDLSLVPGVALSKEQIAALRRDIVWMVVEDVRLPDGTMTRALAPKVYFSQFGPMKLNPGGALIAANELNFKSGGVFDNNGAVISDTATTLIVGDLINRGEIQSGGTLYLQAANDISNLSGSISGRNVGLSAGHDIRNERTSKDIGNTANSELGLASSITATDGLSISAGHNLSIVAASIKAGGNASLSAGENITVGTLTTHENSSGAYNAYLNRIGNLGSQLDVGGNLAMQAGNDLQMTAAKVNTGGDMSLIAGGDINLKSVINSLARGYGSGVGQEKHYDETVVGTTLNAGGNVTLSATGVKTNTTGEQSAGNDDGKGNIALEGASINSKNGTVSLVASGNVDITSVDEKHEDFNQTIAESNKSFLSTTTSTTDESRRSTAKGSSLAGTNIVLQAGDQTSKTGDITIQGSNITATDTVSINVGHDLAILSAEDSASAISSVQVTHDGFTMGSSGLEFGKRNLSNITDGSTTQISSSITAKTILTQSGNDTRVRASNIQSTDNTILYAGGNLYIESAANTTRHNQETTESKVGLNIAMMDGRLHDISVGRNSQVTEDGKTSVTQVGSQIGSEGNLNLLSGNNMLISASKLKAGTDMNLNAGSDIILSGQYDQATTDKSTANRMSSMNSKNKTGDQTQNYTFVGSSLDAGNTLNIKARNNIDLTAAKLSSGTDTNLTAEEGQVRFRTQKNIKVVRHTFDNEDLVYEVHKGDGNQNESLVYTQMKTGGKLNVDAAKGVVVEVEEVPVTPAAEETTANKDGKDGEGDNNKSSSPSTQDAAHATFSASTAALVKQPGMEWMGQMLKRDDVDWQKALAAHDHWDYKSQGLTKAGAVILTIVVTYFTAGTGSTIVSGGTTTTATTATTATATTTTTATTTAATTAATTTATTTLASAVTQAAVTSLATTAAVSFANNGGDLGKTLEDMGKSENVKNIIAAMLTAGVMQSYLRTYNAESFAAKTLAGCVTGEMTGSGCKQGATTAAIMAGSTWVNHAMRTSMINDSKTFKEVTDVNDPSGKKYNNMTGGGSVGVDGDAQRVAGTRISRAGLEKFGTVTNVTADTWTFKGNINQETGNPFTLVEALADQAGPTGGSQALLSTFMNIPVAPGGFLDKLDESFAGPHDYTGGVIEGGYDSLGNWSVNNGLGAEIMAGVNIFLVAPLVIPTFMQQINFDPVTMSNTIHNGSK